VWSDNNSFNNNTYYNDAPVRTINLPDKDRCTAIEVSYSYYSDVINNQFQGFTRLYYLRFANNNWIRNTEVVAGANNLQYALTLNRTNGVVASINISPNDFSYSNREMNYTFLVNFY
jgi:hypothetical protein